MCVGKGLKTSESSSKVMSAFKRSKAEEDSLISLRDSKKTKVRLFKQGVFIWSKAVVELMVKFSISSSHSLGAIGGSIVRLEQEVRNGPKRAA